MLEAKNFGASAIQVEHKGSLLRQHRQSEDCLTLNICVNTQKTKAKRPVLVLFHQGDFSYGGSADLLLYGANYVIGHPDVVFVSFNFTCDKLESRLTVVEGLLDFVVLY